MEIKMDIAPHRPAIRYYGGKWKLASWIISHFPDHENYIEPCGGAASVLLQKPRSPLEVYNDLDGNVVNFFQVLRSNTDELIRQIRLTPWSRKEHEIARHPHVDPIESARRFFVSSWMTISSIPHDPTSGWRSNSFFGQCYNLAVHNYFELIDSDHLWRVANRFRKIQIENKPAYYVIHRYDNPKALIYFDPPYPLSTRTGQHYLVETDDQFHVDRATQLRQAKSYVVISGYACPLYKELYEDHGWYRVDKEAQTNSGGKRTESLWLSPRTWEAIKKPQQISMFDSGEL
ncbi:MAG: DNA adenine methylase [Candidatus Altiarchaeales archaeon]|nr:DNA adenine methylase [Candidatus Altiarchaeales archaeon]